MKEKSLSVEEIINEKVNVTVNNHDVYYMVSERFKRTEDNQEFLFSSLQNFFLDIYDFSLELNRAKEKIYSNNIEFFNRMKLQFGKLELEKGLYKYLEKNVEEIDYNDRKQRHYI